MATNNTDREHATGDDRSTARDDQPATDTGVQHIADEVSTEAGARGAIYALAARIFDDPSDAFHRSLADGRVHDQFTALVEQSGLDVDPPDATVDDDRETLSARYNDLFVISYSEVIDPTDGTVENEGPSVSLYESEYRPEVSWNDVNIDLARAYEYFGCQVDQAQRRNHDHIRLQLEFMGYLCRREATVDPAVAAARLDFQDRHLRVVCGGIADALDGEPGTGLYGRVAEFLDRFTEADVQDLAAREADTQ